MCKIGVSGMVYNSDLCMNCNREDTCDFESDEAVVRFENAFHDIKTPLSTIMYVAQMMREGMFNRAELLSHAERLKNSSELILSIIDSTASVFNERRQACTERQNMTEFMQQLIENNDSEALQKDIHIYFECDTADVMYNFDKLKLKRIVTNLLSNALKFTPYGGEIELSLKEKQRYIEIRVTDSGPGVPEEELGHIFERYVTKSDGNVKGQGIGLSIVKELTDQMNGVVKIKNRKDSNGLEAILTLPKYRYGDC